MLSLAVSLVLLGAAPPVQGAFQGKLLIDYFEWQHLNTFVTLHCSNEPRAAADTARLAEDIRKGYSGLVSFVDLSIFDAVDHARVMELHHRGIGVAIDLSCQRVGRALSLASAAGYFNGSYHWLMFGVGSQNESLRRLEGLNIHLQSSVMLVEPGTDTGEFMLFDTFGLGMHQPGRLNVSDVGRWTLSGGLQIWDTRSAYQKRSNFWGITLKGAVKTNSKWKSHDVMRHFAGKRNTDHFLDQFTYHLWDLLMQQHNFSIEFVKVTSFELDDQLADGMFDILLNPLSLKTACISRFQFTAAVATTQSSVIFRHPRIIDGGRNALLKPFSVPLWVALLVACTVIALALVSAYTLECKNCRDSDELRDHRKSTWLLLLGILCQQGFAESSQQNATRITLLVALVFSVMVYQFYSIYIVGYLLILPPKSMTTVRHLLESDFKVGLEHTAANVAMLQNISDATILALYNEKLKGNNRIFHNITEGIEMVRKGSYAFLADLTQSYSLISASFTDEEICDVQEAYLYPPDFLYLAMAKDSQFRELFRVSVQRLRDNGLLQYQRNVFFAPKPTCEGMMLESRGVELEQISVLFLTLFLLIVCSLGLLVMEIIHKHCHTNKRSKPTAVFTESCLTIRLVNLDGLLKIRK